MKKIIVTLTAILISGFFMGCGTEGVPSYIPEGPRTEVAERPLYYGYINSCHGCLEQTRDHVNITWEGDWSERQGEWTLEDSVQNLRNSGLPAILESKTVQNLVITLDAYRAAGVINQVVAIYPMDEPDLIGLTDAQVTDRVRAHKAALRNYPELANVKFAVIYGSSNRRPGISNFDWVGFDDYPAGTEAVGRALDEFEKLLRPDQKVILVPGGSSPWKTPPEAFLERALTDDKVIFVAPFTWFTWGYFEGIANNGMADAYRAVGIELIKNGRPE